MQALRQAQGNEIYEWRYFGDCSPPLNLKFEIWNSPLPFHSKILQIYNSKIPSSQTPVNTAKNKPKKELSETNIIILKLLCQGKSAKKIAEIVHKSESTVYKQIESLKEYFEVNSKAGLIIAAERMGLAG